MMRFLIVAVLVLSSATSNTEDVRIYFLDSVQDTPEQDRAARDLVQKALSHTLKRRDTE